MSNSILDAFGQKTYEESRVASRTFIANVFSYMFAGLAITGVISYFVGADQALFERLFFNAQGKISALFYVAAFAPLIFVFAMSLGYHKFSSGVLAVLFVLYAATMGFSLSSVFYVFKLGSIMNVFFITSGMFGFMAVLGYTTKTDLTKLGSILMMALFGLIIASFVNWFTASPAMTWWISIFGVIIFAGFTAYDMQKIKRASFIAEDGSESAAKMAIIGALELYLDFINMFMFLLNLLGERK